MVKPKWGTIPTSADRRTTVWGVAGGIAILAALAAYIIGFAAGAPSASPPLFAVTTAISGLVVVVCGLRLGWRGHWRTARIIFWLSVSLAAYIAFAASAGLLAPHGGTWPAILVALEGGWYVVPVTVCGVAALVGVEEISGKPGALRWWRVVIAAITAVTFVVGLFAVTPAEACSGAVCPDAYLRLGDGVGAFIPASASTTLEIVFGVITLMWMLSVAVTAVVAWVCAARATDLRRARLTIVAVGACAPALTLVTYGLLLAAAGAGMIASEVAATVLSFAYCLPPAVVAWGLLLAHTARDDGVTGAAERSARWILTGLWALVSAQLACLIGSILGSGAREGAMLVASAVALVLGVLFIAAFTPAVHRVRAFATAATRKNPSTVEPFVGALTPRERQVLALIAAGRSNAAIAAELFVSERTVDNHVSNVFDKLGLGRSADVNRRVQAAAAWLIAATASEPQTSEAAEENLSRSPPRLRARR